MSKHDVIRDILDHKKPSYVPWSFGFTKEAKDKLYDHYGADADLEEIQDNHLLKLGVSDRLLPLGARLDTAGICQHDDGFLR